MWWRLTCATTHRGRLRTWSWPSSLSLEAVKALLPEWWLLHPAGSAEVAALAKTQTTRMVVWLDELQRYLDDDPGLTGANVRALLNAPHPAVIIGTLSPDRYTAYATVPTPGYDDPNAREREVLDLAAVVRIDTEFTPAEQERARTAATHDPRLRVALETAGYGLTQTLAAAPQLVARWEDAKTANLYGWAVLTAALDLARFGIRLPLSADLMRVSAVDYCTSQQIPVRMCRPMPRPCSWSSSSTSSSFIDRATRSGL